jgi:hypothetical protein
MDVTSLKYSFYKSLDEKASSIANELQKKSKVTATILETIISLYESAKIELKFKNDYFESAYHSPITSELEFFISRILYHFSQLNNLKWKILLRRQKQKTAPDIRIEKKGNTVAIIEIKAKAGWIQPFLSSDRFDSDMLRLKNNIAKFDPQELIDKSKSQLKKYETTFNLKTKNIYFLLPTLILVHRKRYKRILSDYYKYFEKTSGLLRTNLILLSNNMLLDLSTCNNETIMEPTDNFERMIINLSKL